MYLLFGAIIFFRYDEIEWTRAIQHDLIRALVHDSYIYLCCTYSIYICRTVLLIADIVLQIGKNPPNKQYDELQQSSTSPAPNHTTGQYGCYKCKVYIFLLLLLLFRLRSALLDVFVFIFIIRNCCIC